MTANLRLRQCQRLRGSDVGAALKERRGRRTERLRLSVRANNLDCARLALVVPKRHAPRAVDRNRIRRIVREVFRLNQRQLAGRDFVVRLAAPLGDRPLDAAEIARLLFADNDSRA